MSYDEIPDRSAPVPPLRCAAVDVGLRRVREQQLRHRHRRLRRRAGDSLAFPRGGTAGLRGGARRERRRRHGARRGRTGARAQTRAPSSAASTPVAPAASRVITAPQRQHGQGGEREHRAPAKVAIVRRRAGSPATMPRPPVRGPGEEARPARRAAAARSARRLASTRPKDGSEGHGRGEQLAGQPVRRVADGGDRLQNRPGSDLPESDRV